MPGLGLHMGQRLHLSQRIEIRQALLYGEMDDPFRTEGENLQVSQYDLIKTLESIVSKGEFIDPRHFLLEINRQVFGHPLETGLARFGGDLTAVLSNYQGNELVAKEVLELIGKPSTGESDKELPGKIAHSWRTTLNTPYFEQEPHKRNLFDMVTHLRNKDAPISEGLDIISRVVAIPNQATLAEESIAKLRNYADTDARLIPFTSRVLVPLLEPLRATPLSKDEVRAVYTKIVEQLYMLDRELRNPQGVSDIATALASKGLKQIQDSPLTVPVVASIEALAPSMQTVERITTLATTREYQDGRELQRRVYAGIVDLQELSDGPAILEHASTLATDAKGLGRILAAVSLLSKNRDFTYPNHLTVESDVLRNLRLQLIDGSLRRLELPDEQLEAYVERIETDDRFRRIGEIVSTLIGYEHYKNPEQLGLIREIIEAELQGKFSEWRYTHDHAEDQLKILKGNNKAWKENTSVTRLISGMDVLASHIDAVKTLLPQITETYGEQYHVEPNASVLQDLEAKIAKNEERLREGVKGSEARDLGHQTSLLREQLAYTRLLHGAHNIDTQNYGAIVSLAETIAKRRSRNPLYSTAAWIKETLDQPAYRNAQKITVAETDDLEALLRMGEIPVPHCQNWKTNSTYNQSLLSFPADANKKLYLFSNGGNNSFGMSLVRLVSNRKTPVLFAENIYANEWSEEHGVAFVGSLVNKGLAVSEDIGNSVLVACPDYSGHGAHGEKNVQVARALQKFGKKYNVEVHQEELSLNFSASKNSRDYIDSGIGLVQGASTHSQRVHYVVLGE